jgi:hypothetical protein
VHEVGAFSAQIVPTFGAKRADFLRETCTFYARIVFISCTDLAGIWHECALSLLLDSFALLHGSRRSLGGFPCYEDGVGGGPQRSRARSDGVNP